MVISSSSEEVGHVPSSIVGYISLFKQTVVPLLVETFGGCAPPLMSALQRAADWRQIKLTSSEYDETTWSARTWLSFVSQRLSVATQLAAAQEVAEALDLSVAADPRLHSELTLTGCDAPAG